MSKIYITVLQLIVGEKMFHNRAHERHMIYSTAFFLNTITHPLNISRGGMQIRANCKLMDYDTISMGVELPEGMFVQMFGQPVWFQKINDTEYLYGIKFLNLTQSTMDILDQYL